MTPDNQQRQQQRPDKYAGTTLTEFAARHFSLLSLLCLFLMLTILAGGRTNSSFARVLELISFFSALLVWLAVLYQCRTARPLTPLLELFGVVLLIGFVGLIITFLSQSRELRFVALAALCYAGLFLLYTELFPRRWAVARGGGRITSRQAVRAACLLLAFALSYLLLNLFDRGAFQMALP